MSDRYLWCSDERPSGNYPVAAVTKISSGAAGGAILGGILGSICRRRHRSDLRLPQQVQLLVVLPGQNVQSSNEQLLPVLSWNSKQDNGEIIVVVQKQGKTLFSVGQQCPYREIRFNLIPVSPRLIFTVYRRKAKQLFRLLLLRRQLQLLQLYDIIVQFS